MMAGPHDELTFRKAKFKAFDVFSLYVMYADMNAVAHSDGQQLERVDNFPGSHV